MKKAVALFLFGIFLFNTAGYFIAFKTMQYQIKSEIMEEMKGNINISELTPIIFDKEDINKIEWSDFGKEINYKGKLYDVVSKVENSKSVTFYCINDKQEESLFTNLEEHINTHIAAENSSKSQNQKKITDHIIKLYFSDNTATEINDDSLNRSAFFSINLLFTSTSIETDSPPPELI